MKLFLHVGMHKTGTSSIQDSLAALPPGDPLYLVRRPANNSGLVSALFEEPGRFDRRASRLGLNAKWANGIQARWQAEIEAGLASGATAAILSAERLVAFDEASVLRLRDFFAPHVESVEVIGYVRPAASYMASAFQQMVKGGLARFDPAVIWPRYRSFFEKYDRIFGRENVHLRLFARDALHEGDVVRDFARLVGARIAPEQIRRSNDALCLDAVALLYAHRSFGRVADPKAGSVAEMEANTRLIARLSQMEGPPFAFSRRIMERLVKANRDDVDWIEARTGFDVSRLPEASSERAGDGGPIDNGRDLLDAAVRAAPRLDELAPGLARGCDGPKRIARALDEILAGAPMLALTEALGSAVHPPMPRRARMEMARRVARGLANAGHALAHRAEGPEGGAHDSGEAAGEEQALRVLAKTIWRAGLPQDMPEKSPDRRALWNGARDDMMETARKTIAAIRARGLEIRPKE